VALVLVVAFLATAAALVAPSFVELVRTGATYEHWSRFIAASVLVSVSIILIVTRVLDYTIDLLEARMAFVREHEGDLSLEPWTSRNRLKSDILSWVVHRGGQSGNPDGSSLYPSRA
jgi:hypothetical protein